MPAPAAPEPERQRPRRPDRQVYVPRGRRAEASSSATSSTSPRAETVTSHVTTGDLPVATGTTVTYCTESIDTHHEDANLEQYRADSSAKLRTRCDVPSMSAHSASSGSAIQTCLPVSQGNDGGCGDDAALENPPEAHSLLESLAGAAKCKGMEEVTGLTELLGAATMHLDQRDINLKRIEFTAHEGSQCAASLDAIRSDSVRTNSDKLGDDKRATTSQAKNADSENTLGATLDETKECVDPKVVEDVTETSGVTMVPVVEIDYTKFEYRTPSLSHPKYGHILEMYDFPAEFETEDLVSALSSSKDQFVIKRVDDTHALALFSTPLAATEALGLETPLVKMRRISEASSQSRVKVKRYSEFLTPFKPRPQTSAAVAVRLLSGSLGVRAQVDSEKQKKELEVLREAKGKRKGAGECSTDASKGDVS